MTGKEPSEALDGSRMFSGIQKLCWYCTNPPFRLDLNTILHLIESETTLSSKQSLSLSLSRSLLFDIYSSQRLLRMPKENRHPTQA